MDALSIVLIVLLVIVSVCAVSHFVISYMRAKAGEESVLWEEVKDDENSSQK